MTSNQLLVADNEKLTFLSKKESTYFSSSQLYFHIVTTCNYYKLTVKANFKEIIYIITVLIPFK